MIEYIDNTVWGPWGWHIFHNFSVNNHIKLNKKNQKLYYNFYKLFGLLLPCPICKNHYISIFDLKQESYNRNYLSRWTYMIHENVNIDLNKKKKFNYDNFFTTYNGIDKNITFKYLDLIFLTIDNTVSIIELNLYINFLKLFIILYPDKKYNSKYEKFLNRINNLSNVTELKILYLKVKSVIVN
jgi:hypothetical protein